MNGVGLIGLLLALQMPPVASGKTATQTDANPMNSPQMRSDARLADVCFVDPRLGWAVGDRGTIWHTDDGGRRWRLQESGVDCPLESVWFIDRETGWVVGGRTQPFSHGTSGTVLRTEDGGRHWRHSAAVPLPTLKKARFVDLRHGWAVGCPSALFPTGVLQTNTGGRSWTPVPGKPLTAWLTGDFLGPQTGVLAGRRGTAGMVQRGEVGPTRVGRFGLRNLRQMQLVPPRYGWLVGDGGLVLLTADLGASWQTPPDSFPEAAAEFDFRSLAVRGPKCWIAGSPGTRVFHTADAGRSWTVLTTGTTLPIDALHFIDDQHGWAVGALGTILATDDGGQTWHRQRSGGSRLALLGLFGTDEELPLELLAEVSGNEGYLGGLTVLGCRDGGEAWERAPAPDRLREAVVGVGGSAASVAWRFPLGQEGLPLGARQIVARWDRVNDAQGLDELGCRVVRAIRIWRPEVIVTHAADDPLGELVQQTVLQAVDDAADATRHTPQLVRGGLQPWQVKKVYAVASGDDGGSTELSGSQLATRLGKTLADVAAMPRGLLSRQFDAGPDRLGFRLLFSRVAHEPGDCDLFSGIRLTPGGEARREAIDPALESIAALKQAAQRRRNIRAIVAQSRQHPQRASAILAQASDLTRGMDADGTAWTLFELAQQYYRAGQWELAAETFELLADRAPGHPLARSAVRWLVQYYAGSEPAWRVEGDQRIAAPGGSALALDTSPPGARAEQAAQWGKQIERTWPELFAEPAVRFPLAVADRRRGFPGDAQRYFLTLRHKQEQDAWWACAQGEAWLAKPEGMPPKPVLRCVRTDAKPKLDGLLDEPLWQRAQPARLEHPGEPPSSADPPAPAEVRLAYDAEFLYLAARCPRASGAAYEPAKGPRTRDPDLSAEDRVELLLDLDRDYATWYRLTIDHQGRPAEACWGDASWNPTWFVAGGSEENAWTAEAAIALDQLIGRRPGPRDVWAVGLQRAVPPIGFQSWSTPAAVRVVPEGFGYLLFE